MNGPLDIPRETRGLAERGIPSESYFSVAFADGTVRDERDTNWSDFSELTVVDYFGGKKQVMLGHPDITRISMFHGELEVAVDVPSGCRAYQAVRSQVVLSTGQGSVAGRVVGLVRDGKVIEERFLNGRTGEVIGMRV